MQSLELEGRINMGKFLYIISAADGTGYTYTSTYFVNDLKDETINACSTLFREEHEYVDDLYMGRHTTQGIDLDTFKPDRFVMDMIQQLKAEKEKETDKERIEYERLKKKFEGGN